MPQHKRVRSLEASAIEALSAFIVDSGKSYLSSYGHSFRASLAALKLQAMASSSVSEGESDSEGEDAGFDIFNESDDEDRAERKRRLSLDAARRYSFNQQTINTVLRGRISYMHELFEYNIPWFLFDRLCARLFIDIPHFVELIKAERTIRTSTAEFLSQVNVAVSLIEVVVGPFLTYCNFEEMPKILQQVFYSRLHMLSGLTFLSLGSLTGGWKVDEMEPRIISGLASMTNLRSLVLNYDCTDTILLGLVETCPMVHSLDITSSKFINNDSMNILIRLQSLRSVRLQRTSVSNEGYIKLLMCLPKLEDVGRYDELGRCIEYIVDNYRDQKEFGLRKFISRYVTTRFLQILAEYCPRIAHVSIFFNGLLCDLTTLIGVNGLSELHLLSCDFFSDQIRDVLAVKGCNLTSLHLEHVDQIDMNALMYISQYCPDLKDFTIYNCELIESTSLYMERPAIPPFMNLENLTVVAQCDRKHLEFLWSTCLHIQSIKCGMMVPTSDQLFDKILARNPMEHLLELSIVKSDGLSIAMAYKLVETCPKLRSLNELEGWSFVREDEIEVFKTFIRTNNLDVNLDSKRFQTVVDELF